MGLIGGSTEGGLSVFIVRSVGVAVLVVEDISFEAIELLNYEKKCCCCCFSHHLGDCKSLTGIVNVVMRKENDR
jgi:hypothetical protein